MDGRSFDLLAELVEVLLSGSEREVDPALVEGYWSGEVDLPTAIDPDIAAYLSWLDASALVRAMIGVVGSHVLSGCKPKHHMSMVRWLYQRGLVARLKLLDLLALQALLSLDPAEFEMAFLSAEMLAEGRLVEGLDIVEPLLLGYKPVAGA